MYNRMQALAEAMENPVSMHFGKQQTSAARAGLLLRWLTAVSRPMLPLFEI
jgi:hypothetical protein